MVSMVWLLAMTSSEGDGSAGFSCNRVASVSSPISDTPRCGVVETLCWPQFRSGALIVNTLA
jgi:hypothetical protein